MATDRDRIDRHRARAWALQVHYLWESIGSGSLAEALGETLRSRRVSSRRVPYIRRIVEALDRDLSTVDAHIEHALENWSLVRLASIDRGILRIATAELIHIRDVPPKVVIQEGIRLAEEYGGNESTRFVNGVLDALYRAGISGPDQAVENTGIQQ